MYTSFVIKTLAHFGLLAMVASAIRILSTLTAGQERDGSESLVAVRWWDIGIPLLSCAAFLLTAHNSSARTSASFRGTVIAVFLSSLLVSAVVSSLWLLAHKPPTMSWGPVLVIMVGCLANTAFAYNATIIEKHMRDGLTLGMVGAIGSATIFGLVWSPIFGALTLVLAVTMLFLFVAPKTSLH